MKCDIIIPIWNQLDFTRDCIQNIVKNTDTPYRLILIDNASAEDTRRYLDGLTRNSALEVTLIRNEANEGFIRAVNQGLKVSNAPYICILNNDTIPAPRWLKNMIEFADEHKDIGLINPQCNGHGDTSIDIHAGMLEKESGKYMEMNQCQGFCMLLRREVFEKIGYLDEEFGIGGFDDTDYSMRAHIAGYKSAAIRGAYVYHRLHASFDKSGDREDWVKRNKAIYYRKWGKHLRIGIMLPIYPGEEEDAGDIIKFVYGLAREWSWVHLWINSQDRKAVENNIEKAVLRYNLPPHQNIRIDYFDMPGIMFSAMIAGKLLERIRKRMKDKRFDMIIGFDNTMGALLSLLSYILKVRIMGIDKKEKCHDWEDKGRRLALSIKKARKEN